MLCLNRIIYNFQVIYRAIDRDFQQKYNLNMGLLGKNSATFALIAAAIAILSVVNISEPQLQIDNSDNLECGFTEDFSSFLKANGYSSYQFDRPDLKCGAFGGKSSDGKKIKKTPIVFVHGNSDIAFGRGASDGYVEWQTGFRALATYLIAQGYNKGQLYTTTWGPANPNLASQNYHSKDNVMRTRAFIQAVIAYTGAKEIVVISHSMGVTLARKAIQGGQAKDHKFGTYTVGSNLKDKIKVFIGLAGANMGLTACYGTSILDTCNKVDGFYPGALPSSGPSTFLNQLNQKDKAQQPQEGKKVYTIWSEYDDLIGAGTIVWGKKTCRIPNQHGEVVKTSPGFGHFQVRDDTGPDLIQWL